MPSPPARAARHPAQQSGVLAVLAAAADAVSGLVSDGVSGSLSRHSSEPELAAAAVPDSPAPAPPGAASADAPRLIPVSEAPLPHPDVARAVSEDHRALPPSPTKKHSASTAKPPYVRTLSPRALAKGDLSSDLAYLDAVEGAVLEEIQAVQKKLSESRQRILRTKNRRLLLRKPTRSDSLLAISDISTPDGASSPFQGVTAPLSGGAQEKPPRQRIISVSLNLPTKADRESVRQQLFDSGMPPKGMFSVHKGSDVPFVWVGSSDGLVDVDSAEFEEVYGEGLGRKWRSAGIRQPQNRKRRKSRFVSVPLPDTDKASMHNFRSFCDDTLWSLLHYDYAAVSNSDGEGLDACYNAYRMINQQFAETVSEIYEDGDLIWVHNYHLMLLPSMLRKRLWYAKIGFFLYTPFPSAELFRILPQRTAILEGILGADLVGFHTYDYSKQFVASCTRLLGLDGTPSSIEADPRAGRRCEVGIYPAGIDVKALKNHVASKAVKSRVAELRQVFSGFKLIVGVDRLDDSYAGVAHKLLAFEQMLTDNPNWLGRVIMVMVAMLPRQSRSPALYRAQQMQANEIAARINANFGTFSLSPVHYITSVLDPAELHALMCAGHVCVVSTVRDGMGLVPHEWTVCQRNGYKGPIILSEFAGSAHSFATALHVNPWNVNDVADKMNVALNMSEASRAMRNEVAYGFVTTHTANLWGFNFLEDLEQSEGAQAGAGLLLTPPLDVAAVVNAYVASSVSSTPSSMSTNAVLPVSSTFSPPRFSNGDIASPLHAWGSVAPGAAPPVVVQSSGMASNSPPRSNAGSSRMSPSLRGSEGVGVPASPAATTPFGKRSRRKKLFVIDYDGTMVPFQAISELGAPPQSVVDVICSLLDASSANCVLILSCRDRHLLMKWFGHLDVFLAAEDGAFFRSPGATEWTSLFRSAPGYEYGARPVCSSPELTTGSDLNGQSISHSDNEQYSILGNGTYSDGEVKDAGSKDGSAVLRATTDDGISPLKSSVDGRHPMTVNHHHFSLSSIGSQHSITDGTVNGDGNGVSLWKSQVIPVMHHFAERTPGVVLEEGDASLTWHFADTDTDFGIWQARDLQKHLESFLLQSLSIEVVSEEGRNRWIKVRPSGADKSVAVTKTLEDMKEFGGRSEFHCGPESRGLWSVDFILCIGDDRADEGMFDQLRDERSLAELGLAAISNRVFTCRVGTSATAASSCLESPQRVIELLEEIVTVGNRIADAESSVPPSPSPSAAATFVSQF